MLDIFNNDAFSVVSLTDSVADKVVRPGRLSSMGLFAESSVSTLTIAIERIGDTIQLVTPSQRGSQGETRDMPKRSVENLSIPHFQRDWSVNADEVQGIGTVDHTPVYPREVVRRALELGASALILAHNHPSGDPTPSAADIAMTHDIIAIAKPFGISVHDHLIVGRHGQASFRGLKLI